jgi:hypothetical protein
MAGYRGAGLIVLGLLAMAGAARAQVANPGLRVQAPVSVDWALVGRDLNGNTSGAVAQRSFANRMPQLARTRIPVLTPSPASGLDLNGAVIIGSENSYSIALPQAAKPGLSVALSGDSVFVAPPEGARLRIRPAPIQIGNRPEDVIITATETGQMASFTRYNVAYTLEVDCDTDAAAALYCNNDGYIRSLVAHLDGVVLGKAAQGEMQQAPKPNPLTQASKALINALTNKK